MATTKGNLSGAGLTREEFQGVNLDPTSQSGLSVKGTVHKSGYCIVGLNGRKYRAHRVVYALAHGVCPEGCIVDHIDRNRLNNTVGNLRLATPKESSDNREMPKRFTKTRKGTLGLNIWRHGERYRVVIGKKSHGVYRTLEEAEAARDSAMEV